MISHNRRKSKIPQKLEPSSESKTSILQPNNSIISNSESINNCSIDLRTNSEPKSFNNSSSNHVSNSISNNFHDLSKSSQLTSASQLIYKIIPEPSLEIHDFHEIKHLYNEIQQQCIKIDCLIANYMKMYTEFYLESLSKPVSSCSVDDSSSKSNFTTKTSTIEEAEDDDDGEGIDLSRKTIVDENQQNNQVIMTEQQISPKRKNFRGTSDEENKIDSSFCPNIIDDEVMLSGLAPEVKIQREIFQMMLHKCANSATRLIRLLMKHFFPQKILAVSSLSGEGYYKNKLNARIISSIKDFIRHRHPKLKNGSINLCMTDVCVQARRVYRSKLPS